MATTRLRFMQSCIRSNGRIFARSYMFRQPFARREYTTAKSKTSKVFEEALWAAGSVAVTIPSCWFLLSGREDHQSHHKNHIDSQEHSNDNSDDNTEENSSEESEELSERLPEELLVESTLKNEVVSHESDEKQKDIHDSNRSNTTSECTSCEGNTGDTGDIDHKTSNSELAGDQCERQDDLSSSDDSKLVECLR